MTATAPYRALVTGASSGIGKAIATELAAAGHELVLVARTFDALAQLASDLRRDGGPEHEILTADLGTKKGVTTVAARLGDTERPVDVLVHSAGIGLPPGGYLGNPLAASEAVNRVTTDAITALTTSQAAALSTAMAKGHLKMSRTVCRLRTAVMMSAPEQTRPPPRVRAPRFHRACAAAPRDRRRFRAR